MIKLGNPLFYDPGLAQMIGRVPYRKDASGLFVPLGNHIWLPPTGNLLQPDPDPEEIDPPGITWTIRNTQEIRDVGNGTSLVVFEGENLWNQVAGLDGVIKMKGTAPWTFLNCNFKFTSDMFRRFNPDTNGRFLNCRFLGPEPTEPNTPRGMPYTIGQARNIEVYNCFFAHCAAILVDRFQGSGNYVSDGHAANQCIRIERNKAYNSSKIWSNPEANTAVDGFVNWRTGFLQLLNSFAPNIVIGDNSTVNRFGVSSAEDNMNFYKSGGLPGDRMHIRRNAWWGSYRPLQFATDQHSGSGMIMDTNKVYQVDGVTPDPLGTDPATEPSYIEAYENYALGCNNGGMNIAGGHHNNYYNNLVYNSGRLPDGTIINRANAAVSIFDFWNKSSFDPDLFTNNTMHHNTIACWKTGNTDWVTGYANRHDISNTGRAANWYHLVTDSIHLPDHQMSWEQEEAFYFEWAQKQRAASRVVGIDTSIGNAVG